MKYIIFISSLIQPIFCLPFALFEIAKRRAGYLIVFSIALGFAYLTFNLQPSFGYDLYRHYEFIEGIKGLSLKDIIEISPPGYELFLAYAWLINSLNLPEQFFPASVVFLAYYLVFSIYVNIKLNFLQHYSAIYRGLTLLVFWLSINYIGLSSGIRNPLANILMFYASYMLFYERKFLLFITFAFIAFFIHPFSGLVSIVSLISFIFSARSDRARMLVILGTIFIFISPVLNLVLDYLESFLSNLSFYNPDYFDSSSRVGSLSASSEVLNTAGFISSIVIPRLPVLIAFVYLLNSNPKKKNALYLLNCIICLYLGLVFSYSTLFVRMAMFFMLTFGLYITLYSNEGAKKKFDYVFIAYLISLILYSSVYLYSNLEYFFSAFPTAFKPILFILY